MKLFLLVFSLVLLFSGGFYGERYLNNQVLPSDFAEMTGTGLYDATATEIVMQDFEVRWNSMYPLISPGETVTVRLNFYNGEQNRIRSGDVVIFENPFTKERVIKRVMIVPWDRVETDATDKTVQVNGETLKNSAGDAYTFTEQELKWFPIYTQSGTIIQDIYFLFWDNIHNSIDSKNYWPVTSEGILGKVEL